jgi:deoxyhypusine synthase
MTKKTLLTDKIEHISLDTFNPVPLVDAMSKMAFQARNTARAARIYERMLQDDDCAVILCLAGSMVSAGLKRVLMEMVENHMIDAIVSTGANIVDQDFFEGLGFHHYQGTPFIDDNQLREHAIDRIYDTYIDEDQLRECDEVMTGLFNRLAPRPYSSREVIYEMGRYLDEKGKNRESIVLAAYKNELPIFCPAFSDCSAGFGIVKHQYDARLSGRDTTSLDSGKDFLELTEVKMAFDDTGLFMIGGGVPKNFAQDIVVAAEVLGKEVSMHKYAVQLTVADERDGALSGSTLKEACSWGKVSTTYEQMVYGEATITFPLIAGYAYHKGAHARRQGRRLNEVLFAATKVK